MCGCFLHECHNARIHTAHSVHYWICSAERYLTYWLFDLKSAQITLPSALIKKSIYMYINSIAVLISFFSFVAFVVCFCLMYAYFTSSVLCYIHIAIFIQWCVQHFNWRGICIRRPYHSQFSLIAIQFTMENCTHIAIA